ncbi:hypothetical protein PUNSTDRAFT_145608 [Punctularia strigosozonata HHB-11173 SS5]|uniref:uncharacterized protein n=1 Tax=Punctularia strigosozonata (strain HHB-11173) TaxID=741275 RepID=UPI0004417D4D|nr:uncharacterized protein PUNSTDRAFT_145608 [Punctularia strigosozonata HHB-11173 SS5]EIN06356.1 hypothetical protein PUNSTDRAFT_145608 [Punctularia strigosozonata HHB-11173 SS5]
MSNLKAHNPFRTPAVTPNPTGESSSHATSVPVSLQGQAATALQAGGSSQSTFSPPPGPPPSSQPGPIQERSSSTPSVLDAEPPPAYTPTPNPYEGESTVELGPRRPFQQAPPPLQIISPQGTGIPTASLRTGGSWASYPGQDRLDRANTTPSRRPPPPRHPSIQVSPSPAPAPISTQAPLSDFARDFYAAGGGQVGASSSASHPTPPSSSSPALSSRYAPPPGPPPRSPSTPGSRPLSYPPASPTPSGSGSGVPDDGRPTRTPVPGHPLLRNGEMLVYPAGYECPKCHNTGFKYYDPSHPCRKCWEKYSRPYSGAVAYAPTNFSATPTPSTSGKSFQRPLPKLRPAGPGSDLGRSRTQSYGRRPDYPGVASQHSYSRSDPPTNWFQPPGIQVAGVPGNAAPGSLVVSPGDPRIGGQLCWRCHGSGTTSFLIFDQQTCFECGGIGRVFR